MARDGGGRGGDIGCCHRETKSRSVEGLRQGEAALSPGVCTDPELAATPYPPPHSEKRWSNRAER